MTDIAMVSWRHSVYAGLGCESLQQAVLGCVRKMRVTVQPDVCPKMPFVHAFSSCQSCKSQKAAGPRARPYTMTRHQQVDVPKFNVETFGCQGLALVQAAATLHCMLLEGRWSCVQL